jgi:hypothetical protein
VSEKDKGIVRERRGRKKYVDKRERERESETESQRQTDRDGDRQTDKRTGRRTHRQTDISSSTHKILTHKGRGKM